MSFQAMSAQPNRPDGSIDDRKAKVAARRGKPSSARLLPQLGTTIGLAQLAVEVRITSTTMIFVVVTMCLDVRGTGSGRGALLGRLLTAVIHRKGAFADALPGRAPLGRDRNRFGLPGGPTNWQGEKQQQRAQTGCPAGCPPAASSAGNPPTGEAKGRAHE